MRLRDRRLMTLILALGLPCAGVDSAAATGPARLLKDINQTLSSEMGSFPQQFRRVGSITYFLADTPATGREIWRTDGTEAGTSLLKDFRPGRQSGSHFSSLRAGSLTFDPAVLGDQALFIANDGVHGWELWKSDGTETGTRMVKEIRPGAQGPFDTYDDRGDFAPMWTRVEADGAIYFAADDGLHGFEMWRTDGTEAGTIMLKDIMPGPQGAFGRLSGLRFQGFAGRMVGDNLLFSADDGVHGSELWKSDGTTAGTLLLMDIIPSPVGSAPNNMFDLDGVLLFWAASEAGFAVIWRSDGTEAGTVPLNNIYFTPRHAARLNGAVLFTISGSLYRTDVTFGGTRLLRTFPWQVDLIGEFDGRLMLRVDDGVHGAELWMSDGTAAGTVMVKDINPGSASSSPQNAVSIGGKLFFLANDGLHGRELWTTDGTEPGTHLVADLTPGTDGTTVSIFGAGGVCFLVVRDSAGGRLWSTDGTGAGTHRLADLNISGSDAGSAPDGALLLSANDMIHGAELWKSDGTASGTLLVKDVNPLVRTKPSQPASLGMHTLRGVGERVLMTADDEVHGHELWVSDWTSQGTRLLKDINPGPNDSYPGAGVLRDGILYFTANDGVHGRELWRTDGTEAGTLLVADIFPGPSTGVYSGPFEFRGSLLFIGIDADHGWELWKSDGTVAGTVIAMETLPGPDSLLEDLILPPIGDTLYFTAYNSSLNDHELWKTDGSQAGTLLVANSATGAPSFMNDFTVFGDRLLFTAFDFQHGWEPWLSDGTEAGTRLLRDIKPGSGSSIFSAMLATELGSSIYFKADDGIHGAELWKSDGTEAGTVLVKDVRPGMPSSLFTALAALDGYLYFDAISTPTYRENELWKTDGTEQGTLPVVDLLGQNLYNLEAVTGGLVWTSDKVNGHELWSSDGTAQGTRLAQDIAPGPLDSRPHYFTEMGNRVFFIADDGASGDEPWVVRTAILLHQPGRAIEDLRDEVETLGLEKGLKTSLLAQLDSATQALSAGDPAHAITALDVFSRHLDVLTPKWIPEPAAADLLEFAGEIVSLLEDAAQDPK